jgi:hypothetical protein
MEKLKLEIDALRVDSFAAEEAPAAEVGTVHGHQRTRRPTCGDLCTNTQPIVSCYDPCG